MTAAGLSCTEGGVITHLSAKLKVYIGDGAVGRHLSDVLSKESADELLQAGMGSSELCTLRGARHISAVRTAAGHLIPIDSLLICRMGPPQAAQLLYFVRVSSSETGSMGDLHRLADPNELVNLAQDLPIGLLVQSSDGGVIWCNAGATSLIGVLGEGGSQLASTFDWLILREDGTKEALRDNPNRLAAATLPRTGSALIGVKRPEEVLYRWIQVDSRQRVTLAGAPRFSLVTLVDVTELRLAKQAAQISEVSVKRRTEHLEAVLSSLQEGVISINVGGTICSANDAAVQMFGYDSDGLVGSPVSVLIPGTYRDRHQSFIDSYRMTGEARLIGKPRELVAQRRDGKLFPIELAVSRVDGPLGDDLYVGIVRDLTEQRRAEAEAHKNAYFDSLTGLPNRRLFVDRLRHGVVLGAREHEYCAILIADVDHFRRINKHIGPEAADHLLVQVADCLGSELREVDTFARLGGDQFGALLIGLGVEESAAVMHAEAVATRFLSQLESVFPDGLDQVTPVRMSIGIAMLRGHCHPYMVIREAESALNTAKEAGRHTYRFFDPRLQAEADARSELAREMESALACGEYSLVYQPQVQRTGKIVGVEALVRWNSRSRGSIPPSQFIPVAEETGFIGKLSEWILHQACQQLRDWASDPVRSTWTIAVNVSASQTYKASFVDEVLRVLWTHGANPSRLKLELTESMLNTDLEGTACKLRELVRQGVQISLDDFGTGYSSLAYLKSLPLTQLKIDQSFVRDLEHDQAAVAIAKTVIELGKGLKLTVIAEGVETEGQVTTLHHLGCDLFQGYYYGRPVPGHDLNEERQSTTIV